MSNFPQPGEYNYPPSNYGNTNYPPSFTNEDTKINYPPTALDGSSNQAYPISGGPNEGGVPGGPQDIEAPFDAKNTNVRLGFIRKVYAILSLLLLITFVFCIVARFSDEYVAYMQREPWVVVVASVLVIVLLYTLGCWKTAARTVPWNYMLLILFALAQSVLVSYAAANVDTTSFIIAVGLTAATVVTITAVACIIKRDLYFLWPLCAVFSVIVIICVLVGVFVNSKWVVLLVAGISCLLFSLYLLLQTQMVLAKNGKGYAIDDYIIATMHLYIDIVRIFTSLLQILSIARN